MMENYELSRVGCSGRDVVSAWIIAAALIFGMIAISAIHDGSSGNAINVGGAAGVPCQPQDDCEPTDNQESADDPAFWLNYRFTEIRSDEDFF
ncbi:MAG: hypothetical protein ACREB6_06525 [Rhodospirillales bacterium]